VKDAEPVRSRMLFNADNYITILSKVSIANLLPPNVIVALQLQYEFV